VLAENEEGYRNLIRITSEASLYGFYRKPRISKAFLAQHAQGLIGFSGCLSGELCESLMAGRYEKGRDVARQYQDIFARATFISKFRTRGWRTRSGFRSRCSGWRRNWPFRWC